MHTPTDLNDARLDSWVRRALQHRDVVKFSTSVVGSSDPGDGFSGKLYFVDVSATTVKSETHEYSFAIKTSTNLDKKDKFYGMIFRRETFVYKVVVPAFRDLFEPKFDFWPECYASIEGEKVLILENLKKVGYVLHNKTKPMPLDHMLLVMEAYGHWHGLSFLLKKLHPEKYRKIADVLKDEVFLGTLQRVWKNETCMKIIQYSNRVLDDALKDAQLLRKLKDKLASVPGSINTYLSEEVPDEPYVVVNHGDCWTNNFMFSYEGEDTSVPTKVAMLDFQVAILHSPVRDLVHFIYCSISEEQLPNARRFFEAYYQSLSDILKRSGCDPEEIFSFSVLADHWKKYSHYGVQLGVLSLNWCFAKPDAVSDMDNVGLDKLVEEEYKQMYVSRARAIANLYVGFEL
ncbi:uncharacterized protein LOC132706248 [Cylas formicarius]|uniref:uncharacterized protein LOC132706248 n=1 Tax=Cylas formicarius TaxID=197179 RepID=UPI002958627C|nr:uncharacterized protein LOC132706248 [Cylas formicarius]